jgi:hypothetical protein
MDLDKKLFLTCFVYNISCYICISIRNIDDKAQKILSEILQNTQKEIDWIISSSYYKHYFKTNLSINLLKLVLCKLIDSQSGFEHLDLPSPIINQLGNRLCSSSLCYHLFADAVTERAEVNYTQTLR